MSSSFLCSIDSVATIHIRVFSTVWNSWAHVGLLQFEQDFQSHIGSWTSIPLPSSLLLASILYHTFTCTYWFLLCSVVDPWHFGTDPDPHRWVIDSDLDPALFVSGFQDVKKISFFYVFFTLEGTFTSVFKVIKKSQNCRNQGFSYFFLLDNGRTRILEAQNIKSLQIRIQNTD